MRVQVLYALFGLRNEDSALMNCHTELKQTGENDPIKLVETGLNGMSAETTMVWRISAPAPRCDLSELPEAFVSWSMYFEVISEQLDEHGECTKELHR